MSTSNEQRQTTRILSLDGGGTWALIQARALQELFGADTKGWAVLAEFDLVVANSGGSIVAGGLVADQKLSEIVALFENLESRQSVFERKSLDFIRRHLPVPRYRTVPKRAGLLGLLGKGANVELSSWQRNPPGGRRLAHVVVTAFDYDRERVTYFRTNARSLASTGPSTSSTATFLDAIHASTTPPVIFFDEPARLETSEGVRKYWDGAMAGYNNPITAGVVEILANASEEPLRPEGVRVLSLGTGTVPHPPNYRSPTGLVSDVKKAALSILDDPPDTATFVAHVMLHGAIPKPGLPLVSDGPIVRMNPVARVGKPGVSQEAYDALSNIHLDAIEQTDVDEIVSLAKGWLRGDVPNQPIRPATGNDPADIGHDQFSDAKAAFFAWP